MLFRILLTLSLLVCFFLPASAEDKPDVNPGNAELSAFVNASSALMMGHDLDVATVEAYEKTLEENPGLTNIRTQLLGYYCRKQRHEESAADHLADHLLWFIKEHPEDPAIGGMECSILRGPRDNRTQLATDPLILDAWDEQLTKYKDNPAVLLNAASFYMNPNPEKSLTLLRQIKGLKGTSKFMMEEASRAFQFLCRGAKEPVRGEACRESMATVEKAISMADKPMDRLLVLESALDIAFDAGDDQKAAKLAVETAELSEKNRGPFWGENAYHTTHIVLGRLALRGGNIEEAKKQLLLAGETVGSPQLNSFGPHFVLAQELLEKGEGEAVKEYLKLCERFWESGKEKGALKEWMEALDAGNTPDWKKFTFR